jgi:hypothetical protein
MSTKTSEYNHIPRGMVKQLRQMFPTATSVRLFVNADEYEITLGFHDSDDKHGASYRQLDGQWVSKNDRDG